MQYCKKQIIIEAVQWTGRNLKELQNFVGSALAYDEKLIIHTLEGDH